MTSGQVHTDHPDDKRKDFAITQSDISTEQSAVTGLPVMWRWSGVTQLRDVSDEIRQSSDAALLALRRIQDYTHDPIAYALMHYPFVAFDDEYIPYETPTIPHPAPVVTHSVSTCGEAKNIYRTSGCCGAPKTRGLG